jgi:hypothetical protein
MRALLITASVLLLAGCAAMPAAAPVAQCPPVKVYSQAEQDALATAVAALPPENPLIGAMLDYGRLRAAARACMVAAS